MNPFRRAFCCVRGECPVCGQTISRAASLCQLATFNRRQIHGCCEYYIPPVDSRSEASSLGELSASANFLSLISTSVPPNSLGLDDARKELASWQQHAVSPMQRVVDLVRSMHVSEAIETARASGFLDSLPDPTEPRELEWIRRLEPMARAALTKGLRDPDGDGWSQPIENVGDGWKIIIWFTWANATTIRTLSRIQVRGNLEHCVSLFREADLVHQWMPFVEGAEVSWDDTLPALLTNLRIRIPILRKGMTTNIHRSFVDSFESNPPGILLVEWTPTAEEKTDDGRFCGIVLPAMPGRLSEMSVQLATTLVEPVGEDMCNIIMSGDNDFKINRRLIPEIVLRKFLAANTKVLAEGISSCLGDVAGKGYAARIETDSQGFYGLCRQRHWEYLKSQL
eukprot:CAMPEP_0194509076 /NCGR_PEP_ID=MMETSP0253-20130528/39538_1 /TAXON_ID=2966 /ORGANISM="Noctiluca scintillans" /LENGTH=395 /DNA_ID=CAMNT_0039352183 /DNA_START=96 /DNA_END=1283 /DNA_ORIENTATION=-